MKTLLKPFQRALIFCNVTKNEKAGCIYAENCEKCLKKLVENDINMCDKMRQIIFRFFVGAKKLGKIWASMKT